VLLALLLRVSDSEASRQTAAPADVAAAA
jgi:hypothetical protein